MPVNTIVRSGNVATDPEVKPVGESSVCSFRFGSSRHHKGEWVTDWFTVNVWGKFGESLAARIQKGSKLVVSGSLALREYEHNGEKRVSAEIRADGVEVMKGDAGEAPAASTSGTDDDDLPF